MKLINYFFLIFLGVSSTAFSEVKLKLDKTHYRRGYDLVVRYENAPANETDWIGMACLGNVIDGTPSGYSITFSYLDKKGAVNGTATIPGANLNASGAVLDGYYYVQYLLNDGYQSEGNKAYFYLGETLPIGESKDLILADADAEVATITFKEDQTWRTLVQEVLLDGVVCSEEDYFFEDGTLYLFKNITKGEHKLTVKAMNWKDSELVVNPTHISQITDFTSYFENNVFTIDNRFVGISSISVYSINGRMISNYPLDKDINQIDMSSFDKGVYLVRFNENKLNKVVKVVVR